MPSAGSETASTTFPPGTSMETGTVETATTTEDDFTVNGFNFGYSPNSLTVKKGDHVKITFVNTGGLHDFHIDEFNVATPRIGTDASTTVEFDATKAGTFQYYCSVGNHRAMGMWGTLNVVD
jgi:nitrosocyanin